MCCLLAVDLHLEDKRILLGSYRVAFFQRRFTMFISRKALIARSAHFFNDKAAVVCGDQVLSFKETNERANRLANALKNLGFQPKDRVATLMSNCLQYPETEFALVKGSYPQVTLNPRLIASEQRFQIDETQASAVILQQQHAALVKPICKDLKNVKYFICIGGNEPGMLDYDELLSSASPTEPEGELSPDDIGEIRYTSGTTGIPKGVVLPYKSRLAITRNFLMDHLGDSNQHDRFLALQPLYHGAGWFCLPVWIRGATHFIVPRFDPETAFEIIEKEGISILKTVPTVLMRLLDSSKIKDTDLRSVRTIIYGGSPMPVERLKESLKIFGPVFVNLYGQLEAAMTITWLKKEEHTDRYLGSIGRPCTFVQVKVVDNDDNGAKPGEIGELAVRGDHQMIDYLNRPEATAETVRDGWIYTGDLGKMDENGFVYLTGGRRSEMIVSGGLNIYPGEVEQIIYQHHSVAEAGVIGVPDPTWGEAIKACVVLK